MTLMWKILPFAKMFPAIRKSRLTCDWISSPHSYEPNTVELVIDEALEDRALE